jgi:hypothetical protein
MGDDDPFDPGRIWRQSPHLDWYSDAVEQAILRDLRRQAERTGDPLPFWRAADARLRGERIRMPLPPSLGTGDRLARLLGEQVQASREGNAVAPLTGSPADSLAATFETVVMSPEDRNRAAARAGQPIPFPEARNPYLGGAADRDWRFPRPTKPDTAG